MKERRALETSHELMMSIIIKRAPFLLNYAYWGLGSYQSRRVLENSTDVGTQEQLQRSRTP